MAALVFHPLLHPVSRAPVVRSELQLALTLKCGQSFRWRQTEASTWTGVLGRTVVVLRQPDEAISFAFVPPALAGAGPVPGPAVTVDSVAASLCDYFRLSERFDLASLYATWAGSAASQPSGGATTPSARPAPLAAGKPRRVAKRKAPDESAVVLAAASPSAIQREFARVAPNLLGLRLLRQPPFETVISFICSQNNNIGRITQLVEKLCEDYGEHLDEAGTFAFPTVEALAKSSEAQLRERGFGYRAKYIPAAAQAILANGGDTWLDSLRSRSYAEARAALLELHGVGPKVADCCLLFGFDHLAVVPVDTHVHQIAMRFQPGLRAGTLSPVIYDKIKDFFTENFGELAGWAHTVLFTADLSAFRETARKK